MARGNEAKERVIKKIAEAFGNDYIGEVDKKYYVWTTEGGERIQIAIALTCPKNMVETGSNQPLGDYNFEDFPVAQKKEVMVTKEEEQNIADLMARLGL